MKFQAVLADRRNISSVNEKERIENDPMFLFHFVNVLHSDLFVKLFEFAFYVKEIVVKFVQFIRHKLLGLTILYEK